MSTAQQAAAYRVAIVTGEEALERVIREVLATMMPSASVEPLAFDRAAASKADAMVVDGSMSGRGGIGAVQQVRAGGYTGAIVLVVPGCDAALEHQLLALSPSGCVARAELATALPERLAALAAQPAQDEEMGPVLQELRRMQQLIALAEGIPRLQHNLNNPLTALLAEAQLLEMEELGDEHRAAVRRMVELCRRLVGMVRALDPGTR